MKCKDCKFRRDIANTEECNKGICSYPDSWFPIGLDDECHFIPKAEELTCGDCWRLGNDYACLGCSPDDSALTDGKLCWMFVDRKEDEFTAILTWWLVHGLYEKEKILELIDRTEKSFRELTEQ